MGRAVEKNSGHAGLPCPICFDVLGSNLDWRTKTIETGPDGTERSFHANARNQPMLEVPRTTDGGVPKQEGTCTCYDARGLTLWRISLAA